jgi:hypothetical protein
LVFSLLFAGAAPDVVFFKDKEVLTGLLFPFTRPTGTGSRPSKMQKIKVGTHVTHRKYGLGKVIGAWRSLGGGINCRGIFDVIFKNRGEPFLHCCRKEYLTPFPGEKDKPCQQRPERYTLPSAGES